MNRLRCFLATILCLALPVTGLAAPAGAEPIEHLAGTTADQPGPAGTMSPLFEDEVDRIVRAAIGKALPLLAAMPAAQDVQPRVVYLQAPAVQEAGPTVLGLSWADFLKLAGMILTGIAAVLFPLVFKANSEAKKAEYGRWAVWAYHAVQEFAALTPNKLDDLAAQGLAVVAGALAPGVELNRKELAAAALYSQRLGAKGLSLTASALADAKATWQGLSGAEKVESSVRAKAGLAVAEKAAAAGPQTPLAGS